ncbi:MAG TPA: hypothetical protein VEL31_11550 [Ktedonobacteraceae bacterium]|nr:hypothetical protein [Ktedonobacteraceae bacterium]
MNLQLQRKDVVVTGGSRGIGRAIALTCAAEGGMDLFQQPKQEEGPGRL